MDLEGIDPQGIVDACQCQDIKSIPVEHIQCVRQALHINVNGSSGPHIHRSSSRGSKPSGERCLRNPLRMTSEEVISLIFSFFKKLEVYWLTLGRMNWLKIHTNPLPTQVINESSLLEYWRTRKQEQVSTLEKQSTYCTSKYFSSLRNQVFEFFSSR
jgi:hypothetical protein